MSLQFSCIQRILLYGWMKDNHENLQPRRILIVRTDRIGDVILTLPMAQVLRKRYPDAFIGMLVQKYTAEVVEGNPAVDDVLYYDNGERPYSFLKMVLLLRAADFDIVFHTHPRFRLALMTWIAGIRKRVGTGYRWYSFLFNVKHFEHRKDARRHELEYNLNLLTTINCPIDDTERFPRLALNPQAMMEVDRLLQSIGIGAGEPLVIIHPGSGGSARDWPPANFGLLAAMLAEHEGLRVIVTGTAGESDLVDTVAGIGGERVCKLVGMLSILQLAALAKRASLFIANSTGPLHVAATVGTPVVGLYPQITALSAARWGPYTDRRSILSPKDKPLDCRKCVRDTMVCECMSSIPVDEVYRAAVSHLTIDKER